MSTERAEIEPLIPRSADSIDRWDHSVDVVVVGLGCAGACAAIEAAEEGARVLVLEAAAFGGGTSAQSGGLIYLGGGTATQRGCGFGDTPEAMEAFLAAACGPGADPDKLRAFCQGSVEHHDWLVDHGVPFVARYHPEHDREPPDDSGLCYSGGEDAWPFIELAPPAPRGHHPAFADAAGGFLMQRLIESVARSGAEVFTDTVVESLVTDGSRVVGVIGRRSGGVRGDSVSVPIRAERGVVLAAGGFTFNPAMVAEHCPELARVNVPIGTPFDDGRAIRMGQGVGAEVVGMGHIEVGIPLTPPRSLVRGILVNGRGRRFINEDTYAGRVGKASLLAQDGQMFFVHSDETFAVNIAGYRAKWVAATAEELEAEIGLPEGSLVDTLTRYNEHAARGEDPEFHKAPEYVIPLEPPYGVVDMRVEKSFYASFTLGGLRTRPDGAVLDETGQPIEGLFAAGRTTAGIAGDGYVSGISLADGTYFGRRAGRAAAGQDAVRRDAVRRAD